MLDPNKLEEQVCLIYGPYTEMHLEFRKMHYYYVLESVHA